MEKEYNLEVSISQGDLVASIKVVTRTDDITTLSASDIYEKLNEAGVKYGIWNEVISQIAHDKPVNKWVTIAKGEKPSEGKDGYVKYHFNKDGRRAKLKEDASGRVNIKDMNLIDNVKNGDILCELVPPEIGKSGMSVKGEEILGKVGAPGKLPSGKNVEVSEDGNRLIASIDGMVVCEESQVHVEPIYVVDKVDSSTGNVRFNGSVVVNGEIGDGFEVHAGEDVTVAMSVGRVIINAGGDIKIAGGILGQEKAQITAEGSIQVKFIQDAHLKASKEIIVEDYVRNSEITASGPVIVKSPSGWITGSSVSSEAWIYCHNIGHETNPLDTRLIIGHNPRLIDERENLKAQLIEKIGDFLKLQASITKLRMIKAKTTLSSQQESLHEKILNAIETIRHHIIDTDKRIHEITEKINTVFSGNIYIDGIANAGTSIILGKATREITESRIKTQFSLDNYEITESEFVMLPEIKEYLESE
ncbi:MAG TPA: FapA family protein [Deltaproteobacteria bacterium]|nr:FapA family protein [Deltaproteobacteria bacterium]